MPRVISYVVVFTLGWVGSWWYFYGDDSLLNKKVAPYSESIRSTPAKAPSAINSTPLSLAAKGLAAKRSDYNRAELLLANHQYSQFVQMYIGLRATANEAVIADYQSLLISTVKKLRDKKSYNSSLKLLSLFLEYEYDNTNALLLFAEIQHAQKNYLASMDALFRARSYAHKDEAIDSVNKQLRALIAEQRARLDKEDDKMALLDFYRRLTELEPEYSPNFVGLAEVYISLGNPEDARNALSMVNHDPSVSDSVDRVYAKINQEPGLDLSGATSVSLQRVNNQFLIDVTINSQQSARLLLDTGASISIISPAILDALGLVSQRANKIGWFNTANGVVSAPIYSLQSLSVDNFLIESVEVGVLSVSSSGDIDGLLGMNFLKHFKFYIDQENDVLFLR